MWLTCKGCADIYFRKNEHLPVLDKTNTGLSEDIVYSFKNIYWGKKYASFILPVGSFLPKIGFTFINIIRADKPKRSLYW